MLTPDGVNWVLGLIEANVEGAVMVVTDGSERAQAPVEVQRADEGVVARAVFGADDANFAWGRRSLIVGGVAVDVEQNEGSKSRGQVWTAETLLTASG